METSKVKAYYAAFGQREWHRLERAEGVVEWTVTTALLDGHLPAGGHVLDLGGGPGRYAEWLLDRGHRVTLADLSPELLEIARSRAGLSDRREVDIIEADARDLSRWNASTFDAVIALGPLYHLTDADDRDRAVTEVIRVARPGGIVAFALMPWYANLRRTISVPDERRHLGDPAFIADLRDRGVFRNDIAGRFTDGYGFRPAEIAPYFEGHGLTTVAVASTHGFASGIEDELVAIRDTDQAAYSATMRLLVETAADPSLFGMAKHLLYVGRTPHPDGLRPLRAV